MIGGAPAGSDDADGGATLAFIVGMSRAGTTWLARSLHRHPDVTVFGETAYWGRRYVKPEAGDGRYGSDELRRLACLHAQASQFTELDGDSLAAFRSVAERARKKSERPTPGELYRRACRRLGELESTSVVVEKTPHHVHWIDRITSAVPEAVFLACIRDPYDFLLSYKHQGDRKPEPVRRTFEGMYHPIVTSLEARQYIQAINRLAADSETPSEMIRLEHVKENADQVLREAQAFLGITLRDGLDVGPENTSFPAGDRPGLDSHEIFWMNRIAGRTLEEAGYQRRSPGRPRLEWFVPLLTLPASAVRILRTAANATERSLWSYLAGWMHTSR